MEIKNLDYTIGENKHSGEIKLDHNLLEKCEDLIIFIRHGARLDMITNRDESMPKIINEFDTPLCDEGHQQAKTTAAAI